MPPIIDDPGCNSACTACHYKDLDYSDQLRFKQKWADSQLGRWSDVLQPIRSAPDSERTAYRAKTWLRTAVQDQKASFGMLRSVRVQQKWQKEFVSWDSCPIHLEVIQRVVARLKQVFSEDDATLNWFEKAVTGVWIGVPHIAFVLRTSDLGSERLSQVNWSDVLTPPLTEVWVHVNQQVGRKIFGHLPIQPIFKLEGADNTETTVSHPIRAFRQVAQSLLKEARDLAVQQLLRLKPEMVLDLYCGTGELSLLLGAGVSWLGIELSSDAVKFANGLRPPERPIHRAFVGSIEDRLIDPTLLSLLGTRYTLYLNPPRSGLSDEAKVRLLNLMRVRPALGIVYLSCSASSLARDLEFFESELKFCTTFLQSYDFFPQTEHFETLAFLEV